jgi:hypothetical protein
MKRSFSYAVYDAYVYAPKAKAVRLIRERSFDKHYRRCPKGVRFGDWLNSLDMVELYEFYFKHGHMWVKFALGGDPWAGRKECIRQAKQYLYWASWVRKGIRPTRQGVYGPLTLF